MRFTQIKAFDYHPSVSTMLIDHWRKMTREDMEKELHQLKQQHPEMNAIRITHSFEAYQRSPKGYRQTY